MAENIEIKARVRDWDQLRRRITALTGSEPELFEQDDTFYVVPRGRLKLRLFGPGRGELIYYERSDGAFARLSTYMVLPVEDPTTFHTLLTAALGVRGRVRKRRWLYRLGQTRVHLDEVQELGRFVELEYVLQPGEPYADGLRAVAELQAQLGIADEDLQDIAYVDLYTEGESR